MVLTEVGNRGVRMIGLAIGLFVLLTVLSGFFSDFLPDWVGLGVLAFVFALGFAASRLKGGWWE